MKAKGFVYNGLIVPKLTLNQMIHKTPLSPLRFFAVLFVAADWIITMGLGFSIILYLKTSLWMNILFLYFELGAIVMAILMVLDYRNRLRWVESRAIMEIQLDEETSSAIDRWRQDQRITYLALIASSFLPFIAICIVFIFFVPDHDPMINVALLIMIFPALLIYQTKKRIYSQNGTVLLADIGMIYKKELVLWADSVTSPRIQSLTVSGLENGVLYLELEMARLRPADPNKVYRIPLPAMPEDQRQELIDKILSANALNRSKIKNDKRESSHYRR